MLAALAGGAAGPLATGLLHDHYGTYTVAFSLGIGVSILATAAVWMASPGKVRVVAGRLHRVQAAQTAPRHASQG
jgi:cyanate permease